MSKQSTSVQNEENEVKETTVPTKKICGVIMPIADHPDYPAGHWKEVLQIIKDSLYDTEFEVKLVSDSMEIGLIHERIVTNIYTNDVVICDVSSKNPNVMFELGMRLAFDKPTIIIKDENTGYSFDTSVIEHINYQSSLRHSTIELFKAELKRRVLGTFEKSQESTEYSPFLKSFGRTISPGKIKTTEIPLSEYIIDKIDNLSSKVSKIEAFVVIKNNDSIIKDISERTKDLYISSSRRNDIFKFSKYFQSKFPLGLPNGFSNNDELIYEVIKELDKISLYHNKESLLKEIGIITKDVTITKL